MANESGTDDLGGQQPEFVKGLDAAAQAGGVKPADQSKKATSATKPDPTSLKDDQGKAAEILRDNAAKDTGTSAASSDVKGAAGSAFSQTQRPDHRASDQHSSAGQSIGDASGEVFSLLESTPLSLLLFGGLVGYALGWLIHGQREVAPGEAIPDYARKRA